MSGHVVLQVHLELVSATFFIEHFQNRVTFLVAPNMIVWKLDEGSRFKETWRILLLQVIGHAIETFLMNYYWGSELKTQKTPRGFY